MTDKEKSDFAETVDTLKSLSRDDLLKTWGFALGLKVREDSKDTGCQSSPVKRRSDPHTRAECVASAQIVGEGV